MTVPDGTLEPATATGRLPVAGHIVSLWRDPLRFLDAQREVGPVTKIYLGRRAVYVVNTAELVNQMLTRDSRKFTKGRLFEKARPIWGNGLVNLDGAEHLARRRLMQPAFHAPRIAAYGDLMASAANDLATSWRPGQVVALSRTLHDHAFRVVARTLFSADARDGALAELHRAMPIVMRGVLLRTLSPSDLLEHLPTRERRRYSDALARVRRALSETISSHRSDDSTRDDLLSMLLAARDGGSATALTDEDVQDEILTLLLAGSETAATSMAWLFHELARNDDVEARVQAELDAVAADRPMRFADIEHLPYCQQVINESLRLHTPTWLLTRRTIVPVELGPTQMPADSEVLFSPSTLHRDPASFPRPLKFDPDRWLPQRSGDVNPARFIPFGAGRRRCIGDRFAIAEITLTMAAIAKRWHLRHAHPSAVREHVSAVVHPGELHMVVGPRT